MEWVDSVEDWLLDSDVFGWTIRLYVGAAVGQTLFVALWATMPWYRSTVGRALMWKSAALMLILDWGVANYYFGPFPHQLGIGLALFALVFGGIWAQTGVIAHEAWKARRA